MQFVENLEQSIRSQRPIENIQVKACQVPFVCVLNEAKSSIKDGLSFKVKLLDPQIKRFNLLVAWAVEIERFYSEMERSINECFYAEEMRQKFLDNCSLKLENRSISLRSVEQQQQQQQELEFEYQIPNECEHLFQQFERDNIIRKHFHLAVVIYRHEADLEPLRSNDIVRKHYF
jgi:hypothetical protein